MNTVHADRGGIHDALEEDAGAAAWLRAVAGRIGAEAGTGRGHVNEDAVRPAAGSLRDLRDALRRLAAEATADPRPPATAPELTRQDAIVTLNALATAWPELVWPADGRPSGAYRASNCSPGPGGTCCALAWHRTARSSSSRITRAGSGARRRAATVPASPGTTSATTPLGSTEGVADASREVEFAGSQGAVHRTLRSEIDIRTTESTVADSASGDSAARRSLLASGQG